MLDSLLDKKDEEWINDLYHKSDSYNLPILLEPSKHNQIINLDDIIYHNNQNILRFYSEVTINIEIKDFFSPNKISLEILTSKLLMKRNKILDGRIIVDNKLVRFDQGHLLRSINKKDFKEVNLFYLILKILTSSSTKRIQNTFLKKEDNSVLDKIRKKFEKSDTLTLEDFYMKYIQGKDIFDDNASEFEKRKIKIAIEFYEKKIYTNSLFKSAFEGTINLNSKFIPILEFIPSWAEIKFFQNEKSFNSLSSGEKSFFTFMLNILLHIDNIIQTNKYDTINLFLDEIDIGLHPEWQKKYLNRILSILRNIKNKKINILLTTHSPFMLSDFPKGNIIFLKDGKNNRGINHKQTFGTNIHTLLSDSFFMEDGLMGEFAKNKIEEVVNFLQEKESKIKSHEEASKIIEIIGEPVLQMKLKKMLEDYKRKYALESKKDIEKQILELQKRLEEKKNNG